MKAGNKVKTVYGKIETLILIDGCRVMTQESMARNTWYHITKVWPVEKEAFSPWRRGNKRFKI